MRLTAVVVLFGLISALSAQQPKPGAKPKVEQPKGPLAVPDAGGHFGQVRGVAFTDGGKTVVTASLDCTIRVWDVATGDTTRAIRLPVRPWAGGLLFCLAVTNDGKTAAVAGQTADMNRDGSPIFLVDLTTGRLLRTMTDHTDFIGRLAFSPDGKRLASASQDRTARVWDVATGKAEAVLRGHTF